MKGRGAMLMGLKLIGSDALSVWITLVLSGRAKAQESFVPPAAAVTQAAQSDKLPGLRIVHDLFRPTHTFGVTWSPDSTKLAAYSDWSNLITVWNLDGSLLKEIRREGDHYTGNSALVFLRRNSEIGARPLSYKDSVDAVHIYDIETGDVRQKLPGPRPRPDQGRGVNWVKMMATSPDQSLLAVRFGSWEYHPVTLYATSDWHKLADIRSPREQKGEEAHALAFSADGRYLAVALARQVMIFDIKANRTVQTIEALNREDDGCCIDAVAFNSDSSEIAVATPAAWVIYGCAPGCQHVNVCCQSKRPKTPIKVLQIADGATLAVYPTPVSNVWDMGWSLDGRFIAFADTDTLYLWNPSHPDETRTISLHNDANSLAFAPDGRHLAVNDGNYVTVFEIAN